MSYRFISIALGLSAAAVSVMATVAFAQETEIDVAPVVVHGTSGLVPALPTVEALSGSKLERKKTATVGETLAHETGVSSSYFGPNASRPVIRGLDADRLRILQNGTGVLDASAASQDHAVAVDPIAIDRMEIVRGPAALLYGPQAVGGVVNLVTNRIPERVPNATHAHASTAFSTTDLGRSLGGAVEAPAGNRWAIHADASVRGADDYHVNGYPATDAAREAQAQDPDDQPPAHDRVPNSFNHTGAEAVGASYVFNRGYVGTSFSNYNSTYGTVVERFVHINMLQQRWDVGGEVRDLGFFESLRFKNTLSHYKHDEMDHGSLGSTFKNDGDEGRVELRHRPVAGTTGLVGAQVNTFTFSALGDDNLVPKTDNSDYAVFLFEERARGDWKPSLGLRLDQAGVRSENDPKFGSGQTKSFTGASVAAGLDYAFTARDHAVLGLAYTERAPNYEELFANGPHDATGQFEVGDTSLGKERSQALELNWKHTQDTSKTSVGVFLQDVRDFISLGATGHTDADSHLPIYAFKSVSARLYGAELEYWHRLPRWIPGGMTSAEFKIDSVRGINRDTKENLPRMTPVRESFDLLYNADAFQADIELQHVERQTLTAPNETSTDGYLLLNAGVEAPLRLWGADYSAFGRVNNILDVLARSHTSVLKDVAPLPGRNVVVGLQASF